MLIDAKDWEKMVALPTKTYNLVVYWLSNTDEKEVTDYVKDFRSKHPNNSVVVINPNPIAIPEADYRSDIGPQDFLGYLKTAEYVITNSFHACVLCTMFETPFTVFPRFAGDTRIQNYLKLSRLESRLFEKIVNREESPIDWASVHERINKKKEQSLIYLKTLLGELKEKN